MQYKIIFSERAKKQLKKLDKHISALIICIIHIKNILVKKQKIKKYQINLK